jgi:hypothetical protein
MPRSYRTSICRCARILDGAVAAGVTRVGCASRGANVDRRDGSMMQVARKAPRHRHNPVRGKAGPAGRVARNYELDRKLRELETAALSAARYGEKPGRLSAPAPPKAGAAPKPKEKAMGRPPS